MKQASKSNNANANANANANERCRTIILHHACNALIQVPSNVCSGHIHSETK
jgi:hypothetical protein